MTEMIGHDARMLERLRAVLNFAGVGAWEWDLHTGETWWSDHLYAIPTTLAAFLECVMEEDREPLRVALRGVLRTGESRAFACRIVRPAGTLLICRGEVGAVPDETGRRRLILGALRSTTPEDVARPASDDTLLHALREQRAELLLLVEAAPTPLLLVDARQRILHMNPATEEMFGWCARHLLGRGLQVLFADPGEMLDVLLTAGTLPGAARRLARQVSVVSRGGQPSTVEMSVVTAPAAESPRFVVTFSRVPRPCRCGRGPPPALWDASGGTRIDAPSRRR